MRINNSKMRQHSTLPPPNPTASPTISAVSSELPVNTISRLTISFKNVFKEGRCESYLMDTQDCMPCSSLRQRCSDPLRTAPTWIYLFQYLEFVKLITKGEGLTWALAEEGSVGSYTRSLEESRRVNGGTIIHSNRVISELQIEESEVVSDAGYPIDLGIIEKP